ncbi:MAG: hypothetical protein ACREQH_08055 [Candidatus Binatus sp.]
MRASFKCVSVLSVAAALLVMSHSVDAGQIAYEGFGQSFPIYANDGAGFGGPWTQGGFNAFAAGYTANVDSLSYPALASSTGGSISGGAFSAINGAIRTLAQPLGADDTTVYISVLLRPDGTLGDGIFNGFFGVTLHGSLSNDLFIGKPGGGATDQYVLETRGGGGQVPSGTSTNVGHTALLVVKAQFLSGNDTFTLYTNPTPSHPEPASGAEKSDLNLGTVSEIGIYSSGAFTADEIRIGTTYEDVVPKR